MTRYIGHRVLQLLPVLLGVSFLTYFALNLLPGDPATALLGDSATPEALAAVRAEYGLDRNILIRYFDWVTSALTGDLGRSFTTRLDVTDTILQRLPVSAQLLVMAQLMALAVAIPWASYAAYRRDGVADRVAGVIALGGLSVPNFLLAIILILVFAVNLGWLPAVGWVAISDDLGGNLRHALLPAITLAVSEVAVYFRVLRSEMIETFQEEYVTTAYAKGLGVSSIVRRHVLRNSLFTLITVVGLSIGTLIGGAVITETVFAVPGVGRLLIDSIRERDIFMVQGVVVFIAVVYVLLFLLVDILYAVLDPRIRHDSAD